MALTETNRDPWVCLLNTHYVCIWMRQALTHSTMRTSHPELWEGWSGEQSIPCHRLLEPHSFKFSFYSNLITIIGGQRRGDFYNSCGSKAKQMWVSVLLKWFSTLAFKGGALKAFLCTGERACLHLHLMEGEKLHPWGTADSKSLSAPLGLSPPGANVCSLRLRGKFECFLAVSSSMKCNDWIQSLLSLPAINSMNSWY